jgi:hypothetical protein
MESTKKPSVLILSALGLFIALFVTFLYTFLHEAGHAVVGVFFGQSLSEFDVSFWDLSAHVGMAGGELTQSQLGIQSVAGAVLPLLTRLVFMVMIPRHTSFSAGALKLIGSMVVVNTLLPWIILPVWFLLGTAPSDDVTHFLRYSQIHLLLLTFMAHDLYRRLGPVPLEYQWTTQCFPLLPQCRPRDSSGRNQKGDPGHGGRHGIRYHAHIHAESFCCRESPRPVFPAPGF